VDELRLRPVVDGDRAFLVALYAETRAAELALLPWPDEQKAAFVEQQFAAQDHHFRTPYAGASFDVIEVAGEPAGRLYVHRGERDVHVIEIGLVAARRGQGIGERLLMALRDEAQATGRRLTIHVDAQNAARRLYERIGLRVVSDAQPPYLLMEWSA
jgi:ribosomal protein S18 acetylase RimI-like enzyme